MTLELISPSHIYHFLNLSSVRRLFLCSGKGKNPSKFSFGEFISYRNPKTKKYGMKVRF